MIATVVVVVVAVASTVADTSGLGAFLGNSRHCVRLYLIRRSRI
jgi:hypothetical protein